MYSSENDFCAPAGPSKVILSMEMSELFAKVILVREHADESAALCLESQDVISDAVSARLFLM